MPNLLLHIGTPKTGTTSIQNFLSINMETLNANGYYIPAFLGRTNHRYMPFLAYPDDRVDDFCISKNLLNDSNRTIERNKKMDELARMAQVHTDQSWIVSSEHLQSRLLTTDDIKRLKDICAMAFDKVKIILYIRNPFRAAISRYSTAIASGGTQLSFPPPGAGNDIVCNHKKTLERWLSCFEKEQIEVRLFQRNDFVLGDLLKDFCSCLGISSYDKLDLRCPIANESISFQAMRILLRLNQEIPVLINKKKNPLRQNIAKLVIDYFRDYPPYMPSHSDSKAYEDFYSDSDEWVRSEFFPGRKNLWYPLSGAALQMDEVESSIPIELGEAENVLVRLLADIWSQKGPSLIRGFSHVVSHSETNHGKSSLPRDS